jgi:glycosyltransferase involved in cell wall biosynthesis
MRILYLPCHSILEYDEVKLFTELGHQVISFQGAYSDPRRPKDSKRPGIPNAFYDPNLSALSEPGLWSSIPKAQVDWCDVIVATQHVWIFNCWFSICRKPVVYRTIGQTSPADEARLGGYRKDGLKIVRYSPMEKAIPNYAGGDAVIRFYKDPVEWQGWNGADRRIIMMVQSAVKRDACTHYSLLEKLSRGLPRKLYGPDNDTAGPIWGGLLTYDEVKKKLRDSRVLLYAGTKPAPYTLAFIEACMTGTPIVSIGRHLAGYFWFEIPDLIENGANGYVSDSLLKLRHNLSDLLSDDALAHHISAGARARAVELFGKYDIQESWKTFFELLV